MSEYLEKAKNYKGYHYSVLSTEEYDYIHSRTLEMFKQVKDIFDKNSIKYMICGGTLLGALEGGNGHFIPWDDDFDICIFENDYEKAIDYLIDGLYGGVVLQCERTDPYYFHGWIKVRDQNSHVYPDIARVKENGVWIDIYKLVETYESKINLKINQEIWNYLNRRLQKEGISQKEFDERVSSWNLLEKLRKSETEAKEHNQGDKVYIIMSASKVLLKKEWILPLRSITFEGLNVTTFHAAEKYLIQHYGKNYMMYPPDDLRRIGINRIELRLSMKKRG